MPFINQRPFGLSLFAVVAATLFACSNPTLSPVESTGLLDQSELDFSRCLGLPGGALFTHGPTDIANAAGVVPLGNLNPGARHVLAVNHMYIVYPNPATNGAYSYPVYAMAAGEIVTIARQQIPGRPDFDYQVFIRHGAEVTSYFDHVHGLSQRIMDAIAGVSWFIPGGGSGPEGSILFGQLGAPAPLPVHAGEQIGITKSYSYSWDVGVIDARVSHYFAGHGFRRYPDFDNLHDLLQQFGLRAPYKGNNTINAARFIDYMPSVLGSQWSNLLLSNPKTGGSDAWDLEGRLRGAWFNPTLDTLTEAQILGVDVNNAALSIIPDNLSPTTHLQIGVGSGDPYAALDTSGAYPQLRSPLRVTVNRTAGTRINPDPALVRPSTGTVCYDVAYYSAGVLYYNTMLFHMLDARHVAIKFDPTPRDAPQGNTVTLSGPDSSWIVYER